MGLIVLTGAGQGIGFQMARTFLSRGYSVLINDIDADLLQEAQSKLQQEFSPDKVIALAGDAGSPAFLNDMQALLDQGQEVLVGGVCNAGITTFGSFWEYDRASMDRILDLNIKGTFFLTQCLAKRLKAQAQGGSLVLITSVTGHQAHPDLAAYGMTKAALNQLAKNLVIDLSPYGIRINCVSPGATLTERTQSDEDYHAVWSSITPMGKPAEVQDIAETVYFFISDASSHITGQTLIVDGGWTSVSPPPF